MTKEQIKDTLVFLIGCLSYIQVRIMGTFAIGEILVILLTPFISYQLFWKNQRVRVFFLMTFVWLLGVVLSNFWNDIPTEDNLKGIFNVVFIIAIIPFIYWILYDKPTRWLYYYIGYALSVYISFAYLRTYESDYDRMVWYVYAYYPLAIIISGYLYYKEYHILAYSTIFIFSIWSLFNMSRNIFLAQSLAIIFLVYINTNLRSGVEYREILHKKFLRILITLLLGAFIVSNTYESLASNGTLGEGAQKKYVLQKNSSYGLASGRGDFITGVYFAIKKPIVGYGSYAKDKNKEVFKYNQKHGINTYHTSYKKSDMMPGHSYILGAWLFAGCLGLVYFIYILVCIWRFVYSGALIFYRRLVGLLTFVMVLYIWNIFFSPFSDRINFVFFLVTLLVILTDYQQSIELSENVN